MPWTELHGAAGENDAKEVERLIRAKALIDVADAAGLTPLHVAAGEGSASAVAALIAAGADINCQSFMDDATPLMRAVEEGSAECVESLLAASADVECRSKEGFTALHEACRSGFEVGVDLLLEAKADLHTISDFRTSCLHICLQYGHENLVAKLAKLGADVHQQDNDGQTPAENAKDSDLSMKALGTYKPMVILDSLREFILKLLDRIQKESGMALHDPEAALVHPRFIRLFSFPEFMQFVDRHRYKDKRLGAIKKAELEDKEWSVKFLGDYYNAQAVLHGSCTSNALAQRFVTKVMKGAFDEEEEEKVAAEKEKAKGK